MSNRVIHVDILGQPYAVRSELDPQYVAELAAYVDAKMRAAASELSSTDPVRIAVVAGLNLADEVHRVRSESVGSEGRLLARTMEIERIVDSALGASAAPQPAIRAVDSRAAVNE